MGHQSGDIGDVTVPRSQFYQGPYGRMFRNLPAHVPTFDLIEPFVDKFDFSEEEIQQARENTEAGRETILKLLARTMISNFGESDAEEFDDNDIPAGYTYFGQFITHDITFDPTSSLTRFNDPDKLRNFRTPRLDLDSLYGSGPADSPFLYDQDNRGKFLIGKNQNIRVRVARSIIPKEIEDLAEGDEIVEVIPANDDLQRVKVRVAGSKETKRFEELAKNDTVLEIITNESEDDLLRNSQGRAIIGDMRNDENIMISQLTLAFLKFHNAIVDFVVKQDVPPDQIFPEAQRLARWHYQWVIVNDFLPRFVDHKILEEIWSSSDCPGQPKLRYYEWHNQPFIPVEFAVAAFRFGHSMIRNRYTLNQETGTLHLFPSGEPDPASHLLGFRYLPKFWTINWGLFFKIKNGRNGFQKSRQIDTHLSEDLGQLPSRLEEATHRNLASIDLLKGYKMGLPSGQVVAKAMGINEEDILFPDGPEMPLWYYILKEAEEKKMKEQSSNEQDRIESQQKKGKLGPVGGRIVAEVIIGLLAGDSQSFLKVAPKWQPRLRAQGDKFELRDIFYHAKVPLTRECLEKKFNPLRD